MFSAPHKTSVKPLSDKISFTFGYGYLHKCAVCGITDADDPDMEFRYCSKCNGYYCYCMKHINDHVHVE